MLNLCSNVLLLTDIESFAETYRLLALSCEVSLRIEKEWNTNYRIKEDVIICGSKYLKNINRAYYQNIVLILKSSESPFPYVKEGINRFVFDFTDKKELLFAFYKEEKHLIASSDTDLKNILESANCQEYIKGDYEFHFDTGNFVWKGKPIYLSEANKKYLAEWLLKGNKDNNKRMSLYNMRTRLGKDFLREVDRFGQIRRKK